MPINNNIHEAKFKSKAKSLLKSVRAGDADALQTIQPYFQPDEFKLTQAQLVIARLNRCRSWKELVSKDDWNVCSFCEKSEHLVRSLIEGGCSRSPLVPESCVFICDECVEFCAQANADTIGKTKKQIERRKLIA